jgi:hypothetical protein
MEDGRFDYPLCSVKVSVGYLRNGGRHRRLPSPRRPRLCSRQMPNRLCKRGAQALAGEGETLE